jgi:hypothetical protein
MLITKLKIRLSLTVSALLAVSQVSAHPSGHTEITMSQLIEHMLASPFHTGIIAASVIAVAVVIRTVSKQRAIKADKSE